MKVSAKNVMKTKILPRRNRRLVQGAIQLYKATRQASICWVHFGQLQFEVFKHHMEGEYNADVVVTQWVKRLSADQARRPR